jgi:hypothetical protein
MLRIPHCLDNRLTDGGKIVTLRTCCALLPRNLHFSRSGNHFCLRLSKTQGLVRPEELGKLKNFIHLIWSRTRDLLACIRLITILCVYYYMVEKYLFMYSIWKAFVSPGYE